MSIAVEIKGSCIARRFVFQKMQGLLVTLEAKHTVQVSRRICGFILIKEDDFLPTSTSTTSEHVIATVVKASRGGAIVTHHLKNKKKKRTMQCKVFERETTKVTIDKS